MLPLVESLQSDGGDVDVGVGLNDGDGHCQEEGTYLVHLESEGLEALVEIVGQVQLFVSNTDALSFVLT